jgi:hypothetical protein
MIATEVYFAGRRARERGAAPRDIFREVLPVRRTMRVSRHPLLRGRTLTRGQISRNYVGFWVAVVYNAG